MYKLSLRYWVNSCRRLKGYGIDRDTRKLILRELRHFQRLSGNHVSLKGGYINSAKH